MKRLVGQKGRHTQIRSNFLVAQRKVPSLLMAHRKRKSLFQEERLDDPADAVEDADPGLLPVEVEAQHSGAYREVGDDGVPEGGQRLPLNHLAFRLDADVAPAHLHRHQGPNFLQFSLFF